MSASIGKVSRMNRIINYKTGKTVMIPLDHGLPRGPIIGIENPAKMINSVVRGGANAIIFNPGLTETLFPEYMNKCGSIIKVTNRITGKVQLLLTSVEESLRMNADAVSYEIKVGSEFEETMIGNARITIQDASKWGVPILAMMYPDDEFCKNKDITEVIKHVARAGAELGADIVKTSYTGDLDSFREVVKGCPKPIVCAGGAQKDSIDEVLKMVKDVIEAGAIGIAMGRNVWQYSDPYKITKALGKIVHENATVEEAMQELK